jgi:hypothetical protein
VGTGNVGWTLSHHLSVVGYARDVVAAALTGQTDKTVDDAMLIVSELATSALIVGNGVRDVSADVDPTTGTVRVSVADRSPRGRLSVPGHAPQALRMRIVMSVADRWGCDYDDDGKTVWCELDPASDWTVTRP